MSLPSKNNWVNKVIFTACVLFFNDDTMKKEIKYGLITTDRLFYFWIKNLKWRMNDDFVVDPDKIQWNWMNQYQCDRHTNKHCHMIIKATVIYAYIYICIVYTIFSTETLHKFRHLYNDLVGYIFVLFADVMLYIFMIYSM